MENQDYNPESNVVLFVSFGVVQADDASPEGLSESGPKVEPEQGGVEKALISEPRAWQDDEPGERGELMMEMKTCGQSN